MERQVHGSLSLHTRGSFKGIRQIICSSVISSTLVMGGRGYFQFSVAPSVRVSLPELVHLCCQDRSGFPIPPSHVSPRVTQKEPQVSSWRVPSVPSWGMLGSDFGACDLHRCQMGNVPPHLLLHLLLEALNHSRDMSLHWAIDHTLRISNLVSNTTCSFSGVISINRCNEGGVLTWP